MVWKRRRRALAPVPCSPLAAVPAPPTLASVKRIVFQTGGPWHPLVAQAALLQTWLPDDWRIETAFGAAVFDRLAGADLYVAAGLHWAAIEQPLPPEAWSAAGLAPHAYTAPTEAQREAFRRYVASGRPVLSFHAGIISYPEWGEYGRLLGFRWHRGYTNHANYGDHAVQVDTDAHPVVAGVGSFRIRDELYYNVAVPPEVAPTVHARAPFAPAVEFPLVLTTEGPAGRTAGAGRAAYLAIGHSLESLAPPEVRRLWRNLIGWLLQA